MGCIESKPNSDSTYPKKKKNHGFVGTGATFVGSGGGDGGGGGGGGCDGGGGGGGCDGGGGGGGGF